MFQARQLVMLKKIMENHGMFESSWNTFREYPKLSTAETTRVGPGQQL